jgi:thiamine transporter ThiT
MESGLDSALAAIISFIAHPTVPSVVSIAIAIVMLAIIICCFFVFKRPAKQKAIGPIRRRR